MCYPIAARLVQRRLLALDTLYHHLFSTPGHDTTTTDQLKHNLVLWSTHHSFEELPDALPYFAEVKQGGMYMKILCHCLTSTKISHSAK